MSYIEQYLNSLQLLLYWCGLMAEFERDVYARVEAGEAITAEVLSEVTGALFERYWGGSLEIDSATTHVWTFTRHPYPLESRKFVPGQEDFSLSGGSQALDYPDDNQNTRIMP